MIASSEYHVRVQCQFYQASVRVMAVLSRDLLVHVVDERKTPALVSSDLIFRIELDD